METLSGAMMEKMEEQPFVMPINVDACAGEMSMWDIWKIKGNMLIKKKYIYITLYYYIRVTQVLIF